MHYLPNFKQLWLSVLLKDTSVTAGIRTHILLLTPVLESGKLDRSATTLQHEVCHLCTNLVHGIVLQEQWIKTLSCIVEGSQNDSQNDSQNQSIMQLCTFASVYIHHGDNKVWEAMVYMYVCLSYNLSTCLTVLDQTESKLVKIVIWLPRYI